MTHLKPAPTVPYRRPSVLSQDIARRDSMRLQADLLSLKVPSRFLASIINWL